VVSRDGTDERGREHFGSFAAEHLSPAFPQRAPWGTAQNLRAWQAEALEAYFSADGPDGVGSGPRDFLAAATPAPARRPSRCVWRPNCCAAASSTASSWSRPPST
jgi:hypothetical protein